MKWNMTVFSEEMHSIYYAWKKVPLLYPTPLIEWVEHTHSLPLVKMKMSAVSSTNAPRDFESSSIFTRIYILAENIYKIIYEINA